MMNLKNENNSFPLTDYKDTLQSDQIHCAMPQST